MKKLFSSFNPAEVGLLKNWLEGEGIACATRNEQIGIANGAVPFVECCPELWVLNDEEFEKAQTLLAQRESQETVPPAWVCPRCGESNEGQFALCWKCGYDIDEHTPGDK